MKMQRSWAVLVDGGQVSVVGNRAMENHVFPFRPMTRHNVKMENIREYLGKAYARGGFGALMLVGHADDVRRLRDTLDEPLKRCIAAEIIQHGASDRLLESRIEEMCA